MGRTPLVSVVIPAYNAEKYLDETVRSVCLQAYSNWELIIIDDGSTDGTAVIAKSYVKKDKRISYCYQVNQKMASARNAGIARARGEYIAFLDADNIFLPNKLTDQVAYLEGHPECGVCYASIRHFYDGEPNVFYTNKSEESPHSGDIFRELLGRNFINVLAVLVRREVFEKYGAFQEGWYSCDEQYVWINLSYHSVIFSYLDTVVGFLRLHRTSDSARPDYLIRTASRYLELLDIVRGWFTSEEKKKYGEDIEFLQKRWRRRLIIGKLLVNPLFTWALMPLFMARRDRNFMRTTESFDAPRAAC